MACRDWQRSSDDRLHRRVLDQLKLDDHELVAWRASVHDLKTLLRAHEHVTTTRAGFESVEVRRTLAKSALRTHVVSASQRSGKTTHFVEASKISALVAQLAATYDALPDNPFVRTAWLSQAIGAIHPFVDNNGGTGRFLSSIELSRAYLPPFVLTKDQRDTTYAAAFVDADEDLGPLTFVVYDVVQQELAALLTSGEPHDDWPAEGQALAEQWIAHTDRSWHAASGSKLERTAGDRARFLRRGYRIPHLSPRLIVWIADTPVRTTFELAVAPVRAGDAMWTIASVIATVGDDGDLAPRLPKEPIATVFVAAPTENVLDVNARFDRWLATRIEQNVRGLAAWM